MTGRRSVWADTQLAACSRRAVPRYRADLFPATSRLLGLPLTNPVDYLVQSTTCFVLQETSRLLWLGRAPSSSRDFVQSTGLSLQSTTFLGDTLLVFSESLFHSHRYSGHSYLRLIVLALYITYHKHMTLPNHILNNYILKQHQHIAKHTNSHKHLKHITLIFMHINTSKYGNQDITHTY